MDLADLEDLELEQQALGAGERVALVGVGQQEGELVGAAAGEHVLAAARGADEASGAGEHAIGGREAVLGLDVGQPVEAQEHERQRAIVARRAADLGDELLVEGLQREQPGEAVAAALHLTLELGDALAKPGGLLGQAVDLSSLAAREHSRASIGTSAERPYPAGARMDVCQESS